MRDRTDRAGDGNRTRIASLEGWSSAIELHPQVARHASGAPPNPNLREEPPQQGGSSTQVRAPGAWLTARP